MATNNLYANRQMYVQGNLATKEDLIREMNKPFKPVDARVARNRARAKKMSFGNVMFLATAMFILCLMLASYLNTKAELTISTKRVAALEQELNNLKLANDEELERIEASVNLEEIKQIAVEELGMSYAKAGQVVTISDEGSDYVRQLKALPKN